MGTSLFNAGCRCAPPRASLCGETPSYAFCSTLPTDDDNDLALAALVRRAYLPGITADSVRAAVAAAPERFHVAAAAGVFGAEEVLRLLVAERLAAAAGAGSA